MQRTLVFRLGNQLQIFATRLAIPPNKLNVLSICESVQRTLVFRVGNQLQIFATRRAIPPNKLNVLSICESVQRAQPPHPPLTLQGSAEGPR